MSKDDKEKLAKIIFNLPGKIFYMWANEVEKEKEDLLKYLLEEYRMLYLKPMEWENINEEDMLKYLQAESLSLLLELLNMPVSNAAKDYTIRYLSKYANENEALNQVQILMALGKLDMVSEFEIFLKKAEGSLKKCIPEYMIKRVLRRFLITSRKISNDKVQKLISTYFPTQRPNNLYRNILISRERNEKKQ